MRGRHGGSPIAGRWGAALLAGLLALAPRSHAGEAESAYRKGDLDRARSLYEERLKREPGDLKSRYNLGNVLYRAEDLKAAEEAYKQSLTSEDPELRARAAHNLGNARLNSGDIGGAIQAYSEALRAQPGHEDAKYNLELALRLKQAPPPQSQPQSQQGGQGGGEQKENRSSPDRQGENKEQQAPQAQPQQSEQPRESQANEPQALEKGQGGEAEGRAQAEGSYTKEEAERVLDGLAREERELLAERLRAQGRNLRVEKDW